LRRPNSILLSLACCVALAASGVAQSGTREDAIALEQQGRNAAAAAIWTGIVQHDPRNVEAFAHLGLIAARQQQYGEAITNYRKALAVDPNFPNLQMNLGLALFKTDQFGEAIKAFTVQLEVHPGDPRLITLLGMAHYAMGDYLVAIPYLAKATENDPHDLALRMTLARSCLWSRQYPCVTKAAGEILTLSPGAPQAGMLVAEALDAEGKSAAAVEALRSEIGANPSEPYAHFALGYVLWAQGKYAEAAAEFQVEVEVNPPSADARAYLAAASAGKKPILPLIQVMPNAQPPAQP